MSLNDAFRKVEAGKQSAWALFEPVICMGLQIEGFSDAIGAPIFGYYRKSESSRSARIAAGVLTSCVFAYCLGSRIESLNAENDAEVSCDLSGFVLNVASAIELLSDWLDDVLEVPKSRGVRRNLWSSEMQSRFALIDVDSARKIAEREDWLRELADLSNRARYEGSHLWQRIDDEIACVFRSGHGDINEEPGKHLVHRYLTDMSTTIAAGFKLGSSRLNNPRKTSANVDWE
tara:strand:+ start:542 stop:1237 length:696 start_codon:yes stop_codon:yes gene_type:complete